MKISRVTYSAIVIGAVLWCAGILLAPLSGGGSSILHLVYERVCHQVEERSFHLFGGQLAVCARCSSIYFAFMVGSLLLPLFRDLSNSVLPNRWILISSAIPIIADAAGGMLGIHDVTNLTRAITGGLFGFVAPFFVIPTAIEAAHQILSSIRNSSPIHHQPTKGSIHE